MLLLEGRWLLIEKAALREHVPDFVDSLKDSISEKFLLHFDGNLVTELENDVLTMLLSYLDEELFVEVALYSI